jgi:hypothetical protein
MASNDGLSPALYVVDPAREKQEIDEPLYISISLSIEGLLTFSRITFIFCSLVAPSLSSRRSKVDRHPYIHSAIACGLTCSCILHLRFLACGFIAQVMVSFEGSQKKK